MKIMVNGRLEDISACSLLDFMEAKGLSAGGAVVEYNERIVKKADWGTIRLKENDSLEVLRFVGGG
jgi:sulfur carrier protein